MNQSSKIQYRIYGSLIPKKHLLISIPKLSMIPNTHTRYINTYWFKGTNIDFQIFVSQGR